MYIPPFLAIILIWSIIGSIMINLVDLMEISYTRAIFALLCGPLVWINLTWTALTTSIDDL